MERCDYYNTMRNSKLVFGSVQDTEVVCKKQNMSIDNLMRPGELSVPHTATEPLNSQY